MKAFALGGGGGKIGFSAGAVYALAEKGIVPDIISGISSGSLVGIMTATGQLERLKTLLREEISNDMVYRDRGFRYFWRMGLHKAGLKNPLDGKYNNKPLSDLLDRELYGKKLICDYFCGVVEITTNMFEHIYIPKGSVLAGTMWEFWHKAILASTAIPIIFQPVKWENNVYVDGGLHYHTPFQPLRQAIRDRRVDSIYAVSMLEPSLEAHPPVQDDIEMLTRTVQSLITRGAEEQIFHFELMNFISRNCGSVEYEGKVYHHYPGKVIRPQKKLNDSLDFNHKNMIADWDHATEIVNNLL